MNYFKFYLVFIKILKLLKIINIQILFDRNNIQNMNFIDIDIIIENSFHQCFSHEENNQKYNNSIQCGKNRTRSIFRL